MFHLRAAILESSEIPVCCASCERPIVTPAWVEDVDAAEIAHAICKPSRRTVERVLADLRVTLDRFAAAKRRRGEHLRELAAA